MKTKTLGLTQEQLAHGVTVLKRHLNDQHQADESVGIADRSRAEFLKAMGWTSNAHDVWSHPAVTESQPEEDAFALTGQALRICGIIAPS